MTRPRPIDCEARAIREAIELAAARNDAQLALDAANRFVRVGLAVSVSAADFVAPPGPGESESKPASGFVGRVIVSKFNARCAVCSGAITAGDRVLWAKGAGVAHPTCGSESA